MRSYMLEGWIYVLEMVLKVYAFGFENYWRDGQNQFDFIITVIIVVGETVTFAPPQGMTFLSNGECYLLFNFNDYPNGMVTLFNLLVMGNWQSYRDLTGTSWSLIYFISFYLITILLLLNLVVAFVLEAFFAEMDIETSETCEGQEEDSETRKDRPRSRGTKTRSQRVDLLLHHMLSSELTQTCSNA